MDTPPIQLRWGRLRLRLRPLDPLVWEPQRQSSPGPASLCQALAPRAGLAWRGLTGQPPGWRHPGPALWAQLPAALAPRLLETLCASGRDPREDALVDGIRAYLGALADFPGLDCGACRAQEARGEGSPDCAACPRPPLEPECARALEAYRLLALAPSGAGEWAARALPPGEDPARRRLWLALWAEIAAHQHRRRAAVASSA